MLSSPVGLTTILFCVCVCCSVGVEPTGAGSHGQPRRHRLNEAFLSVELVLCELKATLTVGAPFILGFPPPYSLNKCVLGMEETRVRKSTGPSLHRAHRRRDNPDYAWINHQAEKGITSSEVQTRNLSCSDSFQLGNATGMR